MVRIVRQIGEETEIVIDIAIEKFRVGRTGSGGVRPLQVRWESADNAVIFKLLRQPLAELFRLLAGNANRRLSIAVRLESPICQTEDEEIRELVSAVVLRVKGVELRVGYFRFAHPEPADGLTVERPLGNVDELDVFTIGKRYRFDLLAVERFLNRNRRRRISIGIARLESSVDSLFRRQNERYRAGNVRIKNAFLILNQIAVQFSKLFSELRLTVCPLMSADFNPRPVEGRVHIDPGRQSIPVFRSEHISSAVMTSRVVAKRLEQARRRNVELPRGKHVGVRFNRMPADELAQVHIGR